MSFNFPKLFKNHLLLVLLFCVIWLVGFYIVLPHYIELTGVLETWFLHKGLVYYKDYPAFHFPLGRLILYPIHLITSWNLEYDPVLALVTGLTNLYLIYRIAIKHLSSWGTSIALVIFATFYWHSATGILFFHEQLIGLLLTFILYILYRSESKISKGSLLLIGVLASCTILSGQISALTLSVLLLYIFSKIVKKANSVGMLSIGLVIPWILISVYFLYLGGLYEFYLWNVPYYLLYAGYDKTGFFSLPLEELFVLYLPVVFFGIMWTFRKSGFPIFSFLIFVLAISTIPFIFFSVYHPHHINYALPILALASGYTVTIAQKLWNVKFVVFLSVLVFGYMIWGQYTKIVPWHIERIKIPISWRIANDLYPDTKDPMLNAVDWIKQNTEKSEKIMVFGDALFYLRTDRMPSSRVSKGAPYSWNPISVVTQEISSQRPEYWIVSENSLDRMINYYSRQDIYDFVHKELDACFIKIVEFEEWKIWKKKCE